ncbi:UPF0301 protein YqgE [Vibrio maritimus]|uniref:UPF0301 protein YqgE n=1 Tax=Vibrio maritimus TaxID=990268 RepID=A0A090SXX7_9VIBR|nr:UPF0301 protein YqgE [Vibrio maritimus]
MNLANHFLVAMPGMKDPYFQRSVIYVCEHNEEGAMGIMISTPIDVTVANMLKQVQTELPVASQTTHSKSLDEPVLNGGPVSEDRGFILHNPKDQYQSSIQITDRVSVTTQKTFWRCWERMLNLTTISSPWGILVGVRDS